MVLNCTSKDSGNSGGHDCSSGGPANLQSAIKGSSESHCQQSALETILGLSPRCCGEVRRATPKTLLYIFGRIVLQTPCQMFRMIQWPPTNRTASTASRCTGFRIWETNRRTSLLPFRCHEVAFGGKGMRDTTAYVYSIKLTAQYSQTQSTKNFRVPSRIDGHRDDAAGFFESTQRLGTHMQKTSTGKTRILLKGQPCTPESLCM